MHKPLTNQAKGSWVALAGVLVLTPDTLLMRWVGLEAWPLAAYRGLMLGAGMLFLSLIWQRGFRLRDWKPLFTWAGLSVVVAFGSNSITFTLGITETSVTVVLTALATTPLIAAVLSIPILRESIPRSTWIAILLCMGGVVLVVSGGEQAVGSPGGNPALGALFGFLTATAWAYTFVMIRRHSEISMIPVAAVGALISGCISAVIAPDLRVNPSNLLWLLLMGFGVLPISFCLLTFAPRWTTAATVSLIMLLEAVLGPLWVWLGTGEQPTPRMILGAAIVLCTLAGYILFRNRPAPHSAKLT